MYVLDWLKMTSASQISRAHSVKILKKNKFVESHYAGHADIPFMFKNGFLDIFLLKF